MNLVQISRSDKSFFDTIIEISSFIKQMFTRDSGNSDSRRGYCTTMNRGLQSEFGVKIREMLK